MERMEIFACDGAIHLEIQDVFAAMKDGLSDRSTTPNDFAAWVQLLTQDECSGMREASSFWKTWRRLQDHRSLTGHDLSPLPVPSNGVGIPTDVNGDRQRPATAQSFKFHSPTFSRNGSRS